MSRGKAPIDLSGANGASAAKPGIAKVVIDEMSDPHARTIAAVPLQRTLRRGDPRHSIGSSHGL